MKFNRNWQHQHIESGRFRTQFQCLGANFVDRWPRWTGALYKGAFAFKIVRGGGGGGGGALKWPLNGGSRLIQVAATARLTVQNFVKFYKTVLKIIIIIGFLINVQGHHHPHQWAPFQVTG